MTKYNQLKVSNNVLVEVTDQSVYFEYDTNVDQPFALALSYTDFERVYNNLTQNNPITSEELTIEATPRYIHIISDVLTVSFDANDLEHIKTFYDEIKPELQDPGRQAILVWKDDSIIAETRYASADAIESLVESLQNKYSDNYELEIVPASEFQHK